VVAHSTPNNVLSQTVLDDLGNVLGVTTTGSAAVTMSYTKRTAPMGAANGVTVTRHVDHGVTSTVDHDVFGRVVGENHTGFNGQLRVRRSAYDMAGQLFWATRPDIGIASANKTQMTWDTLGRMVQRVEPDGGKWNYQHTYPQTLEFDPNNHERRFDRDADGRLVDVGDIIGNAVWLTQYSYGDFGLVSQVSPPGGRALTYQHDVRGRLIVTTDPSQGTTQLVYNGFDDVVTRTDAVTTTNYIYDAVGRLHVEISGELGTTYTWDGANGVPNPNGAGKLAQTIAYGARVLPIDGDFDDCLRLAREASTLGIYLVNSVNPFRLEGQKTIVFELLQQLGWQPPDWIALPAGNLGNTSAFGKALREARELGLIDRVPRLLAVQAAGAAPFATAFAEGFVTRHKVRAETRATAIRIGDPASWDRAVTAIRETEGHVVAVSDEEIFAAKAVVDRAGVGCEPASAASIAGVRKLAAAGEIGRNERVAALLTGHLLKDPGMPESELSEPLSYGAAMDVLRRATNYN
jgi:YD repeat-containing protein